MCDTCSPTNFPHQALFASDPASHHDKSYLKHASVVGGICGRRSQDFSSASVEVENVSRSVSGSGDHVIKNHTESFEFPFTQPDIARAPAAACNFELDKRASQGSKSRQYWMQRGFVVRYENAYEAKFTASCSGGLARGEFASETIKTPVWKARAPTEVAEPKTPQRMPPSLRLKFEGGTAKSDAIPYQVFCNMDPPENDPESQRLT